MAPRPRSRSCYPLSGRRQAWSAASICPSDGQADPGQHRPGACQGRAHSGGVRSSRTSRSPPSWSDRGRVSGVADTSTAIIAADVVVNCAGMWGRELGAHGRVSPCRCTPASISTSSPSRLPRSRRGLPVLRVPDECAYYKEDAGKILLGAFEPVAKPWGMDGIPGGILLRRAARRHRAFRADPGDARCAACRCSGAAGIHTFFNGPESFTPDDRYMLGEAPEIAGFFVACGFNSIGIQSAAGGAGKALAEWIVDGDPPIDLWDVDIRRVQPVPAQPRAISTRGSGDARPALCRPFALSAGGDARAASATRRCTTGLHGARRLLRRGRRLGARQLVRPEGGEHAPAAIGYVLEAAELVRDSRGRAHGRARTASGCST